MEERLSGTIKMFDPVKGYGFIERQGGKDVFLHASTIQPPIPRVIRPGQTVEFSLEEGPKGPQAVRVVIKTA